jgi:FkbM family methyltransferase
MNDVSQYFNLTNNSERVRSNKLLITLFKQVLKKSPVDYMYEVGANSATFSIEARKEGLTKQCIAFEANPYNFAKFTQIYDYKALGVDYRHLAVSDSDGELKFQLMRNNGGGEVPYEVGNNSILKRTHPKVTYEECSVKAMKLDSLHPGSGSVALWIDVEGAQEAVLSGALETIKKAEAVFIEVVEIKFWQNQWLVTDVTSFLAALGFVAIARDFEYAKQYNILFVKKDLEQSLGHELESYFAACKKG